LPVVGPGPAKRVWDLINQRLTGVWTLVPAIVDAVHREEMTCDIRVKVTREKQNYVQVLDVPVVFPKGGTSVVLMPIQIGDVVLAGFSKWSMENLLVDNKLVVKKDLDNDVQFHYRDAFILGGFATQNELEINGWEIPEGDIVIFDKDKVQLGKVVWLTDGGTPEVPENGMIWRDGDTIYGHSQGVTSKWGSGGGGGTALPTYVQATEPALAPNTQAIWKETVSGKVWLVANVSGVQYKVEVS